MNLKPYNKYKNADVEWLGDIPEHWEVKRVKDISRKIGSGVTPLGGSEVYVDEGVTFLRSQNVYDNGLRLKKVSFISEEIYDKMKSSQLKPLDILINITGASIGRSCLVPLDLQKANTNQHIAFIRLNHSLNNCYFLSWWLKSPFIKKHIEREQIGAAREAFNLAQIARIPFPFPNESEQTKIANYLDQKTTAIDKKIKILKAKIKHYEALKKSVINETVCRGLDKSAPMKDSGVEWIGEIPKHWENYRVDYISKLVRGNTAFKKDELLPKGEYVALQYGKTYKVNEVDNSFEYFVNSEFYKKSQIVVQGNIIIISTSETIEDLGHSCFYNRNDVGLLGGEQILLKPNNEIIDGKYLYYFSKKFNVELRKDAKGLKVYRFNVNNLKCLVLAIPPKPEQIEIANYLDKKTGTIDSIVNNVKIQIERLEELRKVLINDVVTGKVLIRN
jgi:type I restriction enzyme S subunit